MDQNKNQRSGSAKNDHLKKTIIRIKPDYYFIRKGDFDIVWFNVSIFALGHLMYAYGLYLLAAEQLVTTWIYTVCMMYIIGTSVGAGAHRLWSHKSYEASYVLQTYLMLGHTLAGHNSAFVWARDHRVHHKFSDQDGDPHNTKRGFFFSHCGWLLRKKHPELRSKAATVAFDDLDRNPVLTFQRVHYLKIYALVGFFIPMAIPVVAWNESWWNAFFVTYAWRLVNTLHGTWFVNSAGHMFGDKPYNGEIKPVENWMVSFGSAGEGYHNYHHTFPFDYATSEGSYMHNVTKRVIEFYAFIGLAKNLRRPTLEQIEHRKLKTLAGSSGPANLMWT